MTDTLTFLPAALSGPWPLLTFGALLLGYAGGVAHFRTLETVARGIVAGRPSAVLLQLLRLVALAALLGGLALLGAVPLIAGAGGVLLGRRRVLARAQGAS
ncbi:hypothetical protein [Oceanibium sediminis]|uniref:hypothetical protein n=1 Tax=Oceanibium sediminis TaxID=2026339 RepID=UPI000DD39754|nr:hypothetical protein [Oceanibium sediminis]